MHRNVTIGKVRNLPEPKSRFGLVSFLGAVLLLNLANTGYAANFVEGFTEPYRDVDIAAGEMGTLAAIEVKEGDRVTAGQIVARLDEEVLQATLEMVRAEADFQGRLESAVAEFELQSDLLARLEELRAQKHASHQEVARAQTQKMIAEARLKSVREELAVKQREVQRITAQLKQRRLVSPIDGVVTRIYKDVGEFLSPSDPVAIKVVQLDPLLVVFAVPFDAARRFKANETVRVRVDSKSNEVEGLIEFVSPTADPQSGTTRVRVRLPNPDEQLLSGIPCRLLVPSDSPLKPADERSVRKKP